MTDCCKACGRDAQFTPRTDALLDWVHLSSWPSWLDDICANCIFALRNYSDVEGDDIAPITEHCLNAYLAEMLREVAERLRTKKTVAYCEAFDGHCLPDLPPSQCDRFASATVSGRSVCWLHRDRALKRGQELTFVGADSSLPRPFLIWAKSAAQLTSRAAELAQTFDQASA